MFPHRDPLRVGTVGSFSSWAISNPNVTAGFFATFLAAAGVGYSVATNVKMEDMPQLEPRWTVIPFSCTRCSDDGSEDGPNES